METVSRSPPWPEQQGPKKKRDSDTKTMNVTCLNCVAKIRTNSFRVNSSEQNERMMGRICCFVGIDIYDNNFSGITVYCELLLTQCNQKNKVGNQVVSTLRRLHKKSALQKVGMSCIVKQGHSSFSSQLLKFRFTVKYCSY